MGSWTDLFRVVFQPFCIRNIRIGKLRYRGNAIWETWSDIFSSIRDCWWSRCEQRVTGAAGRPGQAPQFAPAEDKICYVRC
jgi:hypothetical protein